MKLYELTQNYLNLQDLLENQDIPQDMIEEALNNVKDDMEIKAESIAKLIKTLDIEAKGIKGEIERLTERKKHLENRQKNLREYLQSTMETTGQEKIKTNLFTFYIQNNVPSLNIDDLDKLEDKYKVLKFEPDRKAIMRDLQEGKTIEGITVTQSKGLRIR